MWGRSLIKVRKVIYDQAYCRHMLNLTLEKNYDNSREKTFGGSGVESSRRVRQIADQMVN